MRLEACPVSLCGHHDSIPPPPRATSLHQFWRPLCTIDTSQWYRWFHSDKLVLILRPDYPLPKNLLQQSSSGRYGAPLCRPAASRLFELLKEWSSVVLREGHSYMRFLPSDEHPRYFCFVRVAQKYPCLVLHIGHIESTPHHLQRHTCATLTRSLQQLSLLAAPTTTKRKLLRNKGSSSVTGQPVVTIVGKQLQRVMIRWVWLNV